MAKALTRRVLKATTLLGSTQVMSMACSVVRMKLLSIWVGELGVGLMGAISQAADFIGNATQLSMRTTAVRDLAAAPPSHRSQVLICVRRYGLLLGLIGFAIMFLLAPQIAEFTYGSGVFGWAYRISALSILFTSLLGSETVVLQAYGEYKAIAMRGLLSAILGLLIALPLFYVLRENGVAFAILGYSLVGWLTALHLSRRHRAIKPLPTWKSSLSLGKGFIAVGAILTVTSLVTDAVNFAFIGFIGRHGEVALGHFQAGYTMLWRYVGICFTAFAVEFYPRLSRVAHNRRATSLMITHQAMLFTILAVPFAALAIALAPWLVRQLFRQSFMPMLPYFVWGMVGMILRPLSITMSYSFLAANRGRVYAITEIMSSLAGLALNITGFTLGGFTGLGLALIAWLLIDLTIILLGARLCDAPMPRTRAIVAALLAPVPVALLALALH